METSTLQLGHARDDDDDDDEIELGIYIPQFDVVNMKMEGVQFFDPFKGVI